MKTFTDAVTEGVKLGFNHAREHPESTLDEFLSQIKDLQRQFKDMTKAQLQMLATSEDNHK